MTRTRRSRFKRVPRSERNIRIQPRDVSIIEHIYRHRCLRTGQIISLVQPLFPGRYGEDTIKRRLRELFDDQYLDRPLAQRRIADAWDGNTELIHAIGNRGADILERSCGIPRGKIDWACKNNELKDLYIEHTLLEADVMVAVELVCREHPTIELVHAEDILENAPEETKGLSEPFKWKVLVLHNGRDQRVPVEPDRVFALDFLDEGRRAHFFLEADRGTMVVEPLGTTLQKPSIYRKLAGYYATWSDGYQTDLFNMGSFRALFVTTKCARKPSRVDNIIRSNKKVNGGEGWRGFLVINYETLFAHPILEAPWLNGRGELTKLTD